VVATGSGVALAQDLVVTNKHVIDDGAAWRIRQGSKTWPATLTHLHADHDLCGLKAEGLRAVPVPVRASSTLSVGERVYAIGAPEGLEPTLSEGLISGIRDYESGRVIQTSAAISHGSSGGGLFDAQGRLVGVTTFFLKEGQSLNFALPGEWVQALTSHSVRGHKPRLIVQPSKLCSELMTSVTTKRQSEASAKAVRLKPGVDIYWVLLGQTYSALHQYDQAVKACQEAIRLKPGDADFWFQLGNSYLDSDHYGEAVKSFQETIRLMPDGAYAWMQLGGAYYFLQQYDEAVKAYQQAIRLKPNDARAWAFLGVAYHDSHKYDQAVRAYQEAIRLRPDDAGPWTSLGDAYVYLHDYNQAVRAYREAIRLKPQYVGAWYWLGIAYHDQDNRSGVMQVYQELKALDPNKADKFFQKYVLP